MIKVFFGLLTLLLSSLSSANTIHITEESNGSQVGKQLEYVTVQTGKFTIDTITDSSNQDKFIPLNSDTFASGNNIGDHWFKADIVNQLKDKTIWLVMEPMAPYVDVFLLNDAGYVVSHIHSGKAVPVNQRPVQYSNLIIPLELEPNKHYQLYINLQSPVATRSTFNLATPDKFISEVYFAQMLQTLFIGVMIVMA